MSRSVFDLRQIFHIWNESISIIDMKIEDVNRTGSAIIPCLSVSTLILITEPHSHTHREVLQLGGLEQLKRVDRCSGRVGEGEGGKFTSCIQVSN